MYGHQDIKPWRGDLSWRHPWSVRRDFYIGRKMRETNKVVDGLSGILSHTSWTLLLELGVLVPMLVKRPPHFPLKDTECLYLFHLSIEISVLVNWELGRLTPPHPLPPDEVRVAWLYRAYFVSDRLGSSNKNEDSVARKRILPICCCIYLLQRIRSSSLQVPALCQTIKVEGVLLQALGWPRL